MVERHWVWVLLAGFLLIQGCKHPQVVAPTPPVPTVSYAFFIAGHAYGDLNPNGMGIHGPFKDYFDQLNQHPAIELGVLTGDIVRSSTHAQWDSIESDLSLLDDTVYFAAGNHDVGRSTSRAVFESRYGNTYFSFLHQKDLFIVLDPNLDGWNITGSQLDFLQRTLDLHAGQVDHIFVFFHQLIWWEPDNQFKNLRPNSFEGRKDSSNFWTEVEPLFHDLPIPVVMCAGDVGAIFGWPFDPFMYVSYDNITLIASGMGNRKQDNIVVIEVLTDKSLQFRLIALNGDDPDALGRLEDYELP